MSTSDWEAIEGFFTDAAFSPRCDESALYIAAVGDLNLSARSGPTGLRPKAATRTQFGAQNNYPQVSGILELLC